MGDKNKEPELASEDVGEAEQARKGGAKKPVSEPAVGEAEQARKGGGDEDVGEAEQA